MQKERVTSANKAYLIIGIITSVLFIISIIVMIEVIIKDKAYIMIPLLVIIFFVFGAMPVVLITSYKNRKEFYIYSLEKKGSINFDEIYKEYIQVKDTLSKLYFVKEKDKKAYLSYKLFHD